MTNYVADTGCDAGQHADDMDAYDRLPRSIRDKLKIARTNMCSACIRNMTKRRGGIQKAADYLDHERTHRQCWVRGRGRLLQILVREEELPP